MLLPQGTPFVVDLFIGACLCATSIDISAQVLREHGGARSTEDRVILGAAVNDNILGLLVLVAATGLVSAMGAGGSLPWGAVGLVAGVLWSLVVRRVRVLQHAIFTTQAFAIVVYGIVELPGFIGAIAALVMGIVLGNAARMTDRFRSLPKNLLARISNRDRQVFAEVVFLMKTFLFVYIGISMRLSSTPLLLAVAAVLFTTLATAGQVFVLERRLVPGAQRWLFGRYPEALHGREDVR